MKRFYGTGLPGVDPAELTGPFVVIEGQDGAGRSTHVRLLQDWLEGQGRAVATVGLRRSALIARELSNAKQGNMLGRTTMSLFYATDLADQLEVHVSTISRRIKNICNELLQHFTTIATLFVTLCNIPACFTVSCHMAVGA